MRGASSFLATSAPQIYVDGIRADDDPATLLVPVGGQTTSRVDDIDVERIATIAILPARRRRRCTGRTPPRSAAHHDEAGSPRSVAAAGIFVARGGRTAARFSGNFHGVDSSGARCLAADVASGRCRLFSGNVLDASRLISVPPWIPAAVRRERVRRERLAAILGRGSMGRIRRRIRVARRRAKPGSQPRVVCGPTC